MVLRTCVVSYIVIVAVAAVSVIVEDTVEYFMITETCVDVRVVVVTTTELETSVVKGAITVTNTDFVNDTVPPGTVTMEVALPVTVVVLV